MTGLPRDMEEEVLSRLPVTSVGELRSTCKKWNTLTKGEGFLKRHMSEAAKKRQRKGIEVVMMLEYRVSLMSVDLIHPSIERIGSLDADGVDISKIFHCDGLFLCTTKDRDKDKELVVCNPYLGQTRWIEPRKSYHRFDSYALGYEKKIHKVLRFVNAYDPRVKRRVCEFEIYSLNSSTWKFVDHFTPDWRTSFLRCGVTLKGNTYWYAQEMPVGPPRKIYELPDFLLCFDFTRERFGPRLPLPFNAFTTDTVALSSVREDQLAVLFQKYGAPAYTLKIWITTKIEPTAVSWSNLFLSADMKPLIGFRFSDHSVSFFVDQEKKVVVVLDKDTGKFRPPTRNIAYIIGSNGYFGQVDLGVSKVNFLYPLVCSYVPSSVQIPRQPQ